MVVGYIYGVHFSYRGAWDRKSTTFLGSHVSSRLLTGGFQYSLTLV